VMSLLAATMDHSTWHELNRNGGKPPIPDSSISVTWFWMFMSLNFSILFSSTRCRTVQPGWEVLVLSATLN
jgi:hypothetical protein